MMEWLAMLEVRGVGLWRLEEGEADMTDKRRQRMVKAMMEWLAMLEVRGVGATTWSRLRHCLRYCPQLKVKLVLVLKGKSSSSLSSRSWVARGLYWPDCMEESLYLST